VIAVTCFMGLSVAQTTEALWGQPGAHYASQLIEAMAQGGTVDFMYDGKYRVVEVHAVGRSPKDQSLVMRGYQLAGAASRPLPQWTLFSINKIDMLEQRPQRSEAPREGYAMGDKQMSPVLAQLAL
jgi:hypothetical protein